MQQTSRGLVPFVGGAGHKWKYAWINRVGRVSFQAGNALH